MEEEGRILCQSPPESLVVGFKSTLTGPRQRKPSVIWVLCWSKVLGMQNKEQKLRAFSWTQISISPLGNLDDGTVSKVANKE